MTTTTEDPGAALRGLAVGESVTFRAGDGSTVKVMRTRHAVMLVVRYIGHTNAWGQAFTPDAAPRIVQAILDSPAAFVRP